MPWAGSKSHPPPGTGDVQLLHEDPPAGMSLSFNQSKIYPALASGSLPTLTAVWGVPWGMIPGVWRLKSCRELEGKFDAQKCKSRWARTEEHHQQLVLLLTCLCLFCRADQGSQAGWAQMGCRYVLCESQSCQPWGHPHDPPSVPSRPKHHRFVSTSPPDNCCNCVFTGQDGGDWGEWSTWLPSKCPSLLLPFINSSP